LVVGCMVDGWLALRAVDVCICRRA
jgi:hypothetical protein